MKHEPSRRHFLIRLAETEQLCCAVRALAGEGGGGADVGEATVRALMAAHLEAAGEQPGRGAQPAASGSRAAGAVTDPE